MWLINSAVFFFIIFLFEGGCGGGRWRRVAGLVLKVGSKVIMVVVGGSVGSWSRRWRCLCCQGRLHRADLVLEVGTIVVVSRSFGWRMIRKPLRRWRKIFGLNLTGFVSANPFLQIVFAAFHAARIRILVSAGHVGASLLVGTGRLENSGSLLLVDGGVVD